MSGPVGPKFDPRFSRHAQQPRADKLNARQRLLCRADPAFREALRSRVANPERFAAFLSGSSYYIDIDQPCTGCGSGKRRVRDRSCYGCHLRRGRENFERMRAGIAPVVRRSKDGHLDLLDRQRAERLGECETRTFGTITATRWPTGRLEVLFPDGYREHDLAKRGGRQVHRLTAIVPELKDALVWAGWF